MLSTLCEVFASVEKHLQVPSTSIWPLLLTNKVYWGSESCVEL